MIKTAPVIFLILAMIQLSVPMYIILSKEIILTAGKVFKFETLPVDPYDAFRGRYVSFRIANTIVTPEAGFDNDETVYALITNGTNGFSYFYKVRKDRPSGQDYIRTRIDYAERGYVTIAIPFDKYYIEEDEAAAQSGSDHSGRGTNERAYVGVRVLGGEAVLEELYIAGLPVMQYLKRTNR